jgi:hypothetical protein
MYERMKEVVGDFSPEFREQVRRALLVKPPQFTEKSGSERVMGNV